MIYFNKFKNVELQLPEALIKKLVTLGNSHYPKEFGGFLLGKYSENLQHLIITDILEPLKYKSLINEFERSTDGIEKRFKNSNNYYVGEWHTHPNGSTRFSTKDLKTMKKITNYDKMNILNPILIILNIDKNESHSLSVYLYEKGELYIYEQS